MATFVVMSIYNPSGYSYFDWLVAAGGDWVWKILIGLTLAIVYMTFALATLRSLGRLGIAIWIVLFGAVVWLLIDVGVIHSFTPGTVATIFLMIVANVMAVGLSWSYVRARLSGQADTNNVTLR